MQQLSKYLDDTWRFFRARLSHICSILLPALVPLNVLFVFFAGSSLSTPQVLLLLFFQFSAYAIYQGALIILIDSSIEGQPKTVTSCYQAAIAWWPHMLTLYAIYLLAIAAGLAAFVIPALILAARFSYVEFYCLLEKKTPVEAFVESWKATRAHQFELIAGILILGCITVLPFFLLQQQVESYPLIQLVLAVVAGVVVAPITIFRFRYYNEYIQKK